VKNTMLLVAASLALPLRLALGEDPTITGVSESAGEGEYTYSFTITPNGNTIKDVHIEPEAKRNSLPNPKDSSNGSGVTMPEGWGFDSNGKGYHFYTGKPKTTSSGTTTPAPVPEEGFTFQVVVKAKKAPLTKSTLFKLTNDGKTRATTSGTVYGPTNTGQTETGSPNILKFPVSSISIRSNPGSNLVVGGFGLADLASDSFGYSYQVYMSRSLAVDPADDTLGIGLNMNDQPPASWRLGTRSFRGALAERLGTGRAQITLNIPDDPDLAGETLFLVATMDDDHDGIPDIFTEPIEWTIDAN